MPYAKLDNPQSLNLYEYVLNDPQSLNLFAYVQNDPLSLRDLDGHASLEWDRIKALGIAWAQERALVAQRGYGTRPWSSAERAELLNTGKVAGYQGHHINSVNGNPDLASNPDNIEFVKGLEGNLAKHGGNFQNVTSGDLLSRSLNCSFTVMTILQTVVSGLVSKSEADVTGVQEGWTFRGGMPNPDALYIVDPAKTAVPLDGQSISVRGSTYHVSNGQYLDDNGNSVDPQSLNGSEFQFVTSPRT